MKPAVLLTLVLAAGCMVGPDYVRPPAPTPDRWGEIEPASASKATYDPAPADWWTTFADPHLTSLIERAVMSNLDLQQAASRVRQARAQRRHQPVRFPPLRQRVHHGDHFRQLRVAGRSQFRLHGADGGA